MKNECPEYGDKINFIDLQYQGVYDFFDLVKEILEATKGSTSVLCFNGMGIENVIENNILDNENIASIYSIVDSEKYKNSYGFSKKYATVDGELKAITPIVSPGCFLFNEDIALEVLGTKDPTEVQKMIDTTEEFLQVAALMKEKGYYMTSGLDEVEVSTESSIKRVSDPEELREFCQTLKDNSYTTGNNIYSGEWYSYDAKSGDVFGFFVNAWEAPYMPFADNINVDMCAGPIAYSYSSQYFCVASDGTNTENDAIAKVFLETLCCDEEAMYRYTLEQSYAVPNNKNVAARIIADDVCRYDEFSINPYTVWHEVAQEILEEGCTTHTSVTDKAVAATCTETGLTEGAHCSVCGEIIKKQEIVPALGHDVVIDPAVEAAVGKEGKTEGSHCARCGVVIKAQETIPAIIGNCWSEIDGKKVYLGEDGKPVKNQWKEIDGKTYHFDVKGHLTTGWLLDAGDWYYMDKNGVRITGWELVGGTWYYMKDSGKMATGWVLDGATWYYMNPSGAMATGWVLDGATWYYMNPSGAMATGWVLDGATWYYMNSSGAMATGWVLDGATWYYMYSSGAMATGWVLDGSNWYFMYSSGAMAHDTVIGGFKLNSSGAWVK